MWLRLALLSFVALSLSACSTVPENYAFWRDTSPPVTSTTKKANLGDVPAAPNTTDAKAEMESMKTRLKQDRDNAYMAAQGVVPVDANNNPVTPTSATPPAGGTSYGETPVSKDELAPVPAAVTPMPSPIPGDSSYNPAQQPMTYNTNNVQYNYGSSSSDQDYVYGFSPVQINRQSQYQQQAAQVVATNPNVSIDFSALGDTSAPPMAPPAPSPFSTNGQPLVYFRHGSARLGTLDKKHIRDLAEHLKAQPSSVVVIGYASRRTGLRNAVASENANLQMSAKRAAVVLAELARNGVDAKQVKIGAYGDAAATSQIKGQEAADRRVEILFDQ